jgi:hypothetical protein
MDYNKTFIATTREELYKMLTEFGIPMELFRLIKICKIVLLDFVHRINFKIIKSQCFER